MGKTPTGIHGHERRRHHNYSRNNTARNRSSENQGYAPTNYIYPPESLRRQVSSSFGNLRYPTLESSQYYRKGKSFRSRTFSPAYGRSQLPLKRLPQKRERMRRNMHSTAEKELVSKNNEPSSSTVRDENGADSEQAGAVTDHPPSEETASSVHQTRSTVKAQQTKSDDSSATDKREVDSSEVGNLHNTRSSSKTQSDENASATVSQIQSTEEKIGSQNTRTASKLKVDDGHDDKHDDESASHASRTRKSRKEVKESSSASDSNSPQKQEPDLITTNDKESGNKALDEHGETEVQLKIIENIEHSEMEENNIEGATSNCQDLEIRSVSVSLHDTKQLASCKLKPTVPESEISDNQSFEHSPEKMPKSATSAELIDMKDAPRRSSRKSTSKYKVEKEEVHNSQKIPVSSHSRTPVKSSQDLIPGEKEYTSSASIRSISCRRPLRDTSSISIRDSPRPTYVYKQLHTSTPKFKEEATDSDEPAEPTDADKSIETNDEPEETSSLEETSGKRKATSEISQAYKKICTLKSVQNASSFFSVMSSPFQLSNKEEPVSSSTPLKVLECSKEMIDIEMIEDSFAEEATPFEKASLAPQIETEQKSRKWCSLM